VAETNPHAPPTGESTARLAGLLECLRMLASDGQPAGGLSASTVRMTLSAWHTVVQHLDIPADADVDDLDLDELMERHARNARLRGYRFTSTSTYLTRLRRGRDLYRQYRTGQLIRSGPTAARLPDGVDLVSIQLRPDVTLFVGLPPDVRLDDHDADTVARWLVGYTRHSTAGPR
jgi:hypothetical protein